MRCKEVTRQTINENGGSEEVVAGKCYNHSIQMKTQAVQQMQEKKKTFKLRFNDFTNLTQWIPVREKNI